MWIDNIIIKNTIEDFKKTGINVIKTGPLSAVWKGGSDNPDDWSEVFSPDDICTLKNVHIGKVDFIDRRADEKDIAVIAATKHLTINPDYPKTTPKGGTGYGIIENIIMEK